MANLIKCLAIAVIVIFTLLPGGLHLSRIAADQAAQSGENRTLAGWPEWADAEGSLATYTARISAHFNDQFGGRTLAIRIRNKLFNLVGDGTASVLKGRTPGWYFYNSPYMEQSFKGAYSYSAADVEAWTESLQRLQLAVTAKGAVFTAMIPPDKARIYPEHAPAKMGSPSGDRYVAALIDSAQQRGLPIINIDPVLLRQKQTAPMFYKTDTHWTLRGAYAAYAAIMESFEAQGRDFNIIFPDKILSEETTGYSGDLATMMGLEGELSESLVDYIPPKPSSAFKTEIISDPDVSRAIWRTEIYDNGAEAKPQTLLIIGDSFSRQLLPYFQHSFDRIVVVHHRRGAFDLQFVLDQNPDAVLFAPVEREAIRMRVFASSN